MSTRFARRLAAVGCVVAVCWMKIVSAARAQTPPTSPSLPLLSPIFSDNMVMQRDKPNTVWGWAKPGDKITVTLVSHGQPASHVTAEIPDASSSATADSEGRWQLQINPPPVGYTCDMAVACAAQRLELHNILIGDVWLCGGQSNMEFGITLAKNADAEIKAADQPDIRLFIVGHHPSYSHADIPEGTWKVCSPQTIVQGGWGGFSAIGYLFGEKLNQRLHVPIGLVEDCVGGTSAETWMSPRTLHRLNLFTEQLADLDRLHAEHAPEYGNFIMHWYDRYDVGQKEHWESLDLDDQHWKSVQLPGGFGDLGLPTTPAVAWFRKEITLPASLPPGKSTIDLGSIEQMDTTWINGTWIGASAWVENPRAYDVPAGVLHPGKNLIALRVFKVKPNGGFLSPADSLKLILPDKSEIPLAGEWKGKISVDARPPHEMPLSFENWPTIPSVLYRGMLEPVAPLAISGIIWYQGEANFPRAWQYRTLLPAMIADWRQLFKQGNLPFYIVSLPAFMAHKDQPGDDAWAELREAQAYTANTVPNTALAVTVDTGEADNIHPKDKGPVADRLAACALAMHYHENVPYAGPTFVSMQKLSGALKLNFDNTDGGLIAKGGTAQEFSIAGDDHQWHWADAKIEGNSVIVSSSQVAHPVAARYAWQANPQATLYNKEGLPMVPFRTDDWKESTQP